MEMDEVALPGSQNPEHVTPDEPRSQSAGPGESQEGQTHMFRSLSFDAGRLSPEPAAASAPASAPLLFLPFIPAEVEFLSSPHQARETELKVKKQKVRFRSSLLDPLTTNFLSMCAFF